MKDRFLAAAVVFWAFAAAAGAMGWKSHVVLGYLFFASLSTAAFLLARILEDRS
jgi:hypothetical protein